MYLTRTALGAAVAAAVLTITASPATAATSACTCIISPPPAVSVGGAHGHPVFMPRWNGRLPFGGPRTYRRVF